MKSITIIIDEQGGIEIEGHGFKGKACEAKMRSFIEALGETTSSKKKPEYFQEDKLTIHN